MSLQIIRSIDGKAEYVLLPVSIYETLHKQIDAQLKTLGQDADYVPFDPADYIDNPIALARIRENLTQAKLAKLLGVTQAYISKIEKKTKVTAKLLEKVRAVLDKRK